MILSSSIFLETREIKFHASNNKKSFFNPILNDDFCCILCDYYNLIANLDRKLQKQKNIFYWNVTWLFCGNGVVISRKV